ncbi:hypothetical protein D3C76_1323020 [compost metagenome]
MMHQGDGLLGLALGIDAPQGQLQLRLLEGRGAFQRQEAGTGCGIGVVGPVPEQQIGILGATGLRIQLLQLSAGGQHALHPGALLLPGPLVFDVGGVFGALQVTLQAAHQLVPLPVHALLLEVVAGADDIAALMATPAVVHQICAQGGILGANVVDPVVIAGHQRQTTGEREQ